MEYWQFLFYFSFLVLILGLLYRIIRLIRMPLHLRWELYPVPHEKDRKKYGGSYYEELDWWTKRRDFSLISEISEMSREIFLIHSLFKNNRLLWLFSFPFHIGMYFLTGFIALLLVGVFVDSAGWYSSITVTAGIVGALLGTLGGLGLFISRLLKDELRRYSVRTDYFNLLLLLSIFISLLIALFAFDRSGNAHFAMARQLARFAPAPELPSIMKAEMILTAVFFLYLPFTHMTHFVGKFFTYHKVRWEDHPNIRGSKIEKAVAEYLGYKLSWSAPHIKAGTSWAEAVSGDSNDSEKGKKS